MKSQNQNRRGQRQNPAPSSSEEIALLNQGYNLIAGIDEVGRGCLAGPVVAAAVIMPAAIHGAKDSLERVHDSKVLRPELRESLYEEILLRAVGVGLGMTSAADIDRMGIVQATRRAMGEAVANLAPNPEYLLIDYLTLADIDLPQKGIVNGDSLCFSIAAASIVAKVTRDSLMRREHDNYPEYGFCRNKGYGTPEHLKALLSLGPCLIHRRSFAPVKESSLLEIRGTAD